jgi:hypothetical protein
MPNFRDRSEPVRIAEHGTVIPAKSDYPESSGSPSSLLNRSFRFQLHFRAKPYDPALSRQRQNALAGYLASTAPFATWLDADTHMGQNILYS